MRGLKLLGYAGVVLTLTLASLSWAGPRVAVVDFENQAQRGDWRLGRGAADMLTTELVRGTDFEMFERERIKAVMQEQNLGQGGRVDPATAARIGKILGVEYIITGAVTEYGQSRAGGGGRGVDVRRQGYAAGVDVRIVDAETGRIMFADTGSGSKAVRSVRVMGIGGGSSFNEKYATEALRGAIDEVVSKLARADLPSGTSGGGTASAGPILVADVYGDTITLNSSAGLSEGQTVSIKREGRVITDPDSGEVIRVRYNDVGKIRITEVAGSYAEGTIVEGSGFEVGDIAE